MGASDNPSQTWPLFGPFLSTSFLIITHRAPLSCCLLEVHRAALPARRRRTSVASPLSWPRPAVVAHDVAGSSVVSSSPGALPRRRLWELCSTPSRQPITEAPRSLRVGATLLHPRRRASLHHWPWCSAAPSTRHRRPTSAGGQMSPCLSYSTLEPRGPSFFCLSLGRHALENGFHGAPASKPFCAFPFGRASTEAGAGALPNRA